MEWYLALLICLVVLLLLFAMGMPVAFCFLTFNIVGMIVFFGNQESFSTLILSLYDSVAKFTMLPIPLFLLIGSVMFSSGLAIRMIDTLGQIMGRLPGRLSVLAIMGGVLLSTMGGSTAASASLLAQTLLPEMRKRGYHNTMALGPIMGGGVLAAIIPPSAQCVMIGSLSNINIAKLLIAGIIPGLVMAFCYMVYIIVHCRLQPELAPAYEVEATSFSRSLADFLRYVLPLGSIFLLTVGPIFLGIATPTEAAAMGALGIFVLAALYKKLNWKVIRKSATTSTRIVIMLFMIMLGSNAFSQILAYSGAAGGLSKFISALPLAPVYLHIAMLLGVLFLGTFMEIISIMMITIPIYLPIAHAAGLDPIVWGITMLMCLEIGTITPPFGVILFAMRGLVPPSISMQDIYKATVPYIICDLAGVAIVMAFPILTLWLPGIMPR